jgi:isochorismate synthase EntC
MVQRAAGAPGLEKVVLARAVELPVSVTGWRLFQALAMPAARRFFFRAEAGACFLGATPETLVRWRGGRIEIDALAGSMPPGCDFGEKELREHRFVVRDVVRALEGLSPQAPADPAVMELGYVRHLHTAVVAQAGAGFDFGALLGRLFPTSAVAGAPRELALDFIARNEELERGWYAGAVGRIAPGDVDLAVALRCALVEGAKARLFAGAGIVAGSSPEAEWAETARKMLPMRQALGAHP